MASKNKLDNEKELLSIFSRNYKILLELFPNNELSVTAIADRTAQNQGSISRAIEDLYEKKLITIRDEKAGRGKPHKYVKLSQFSFHLFSYVKEYLEKQSINKSPIDSRIVDEYLDLIIKSDSSIRRFASDQIELISRNNKIPQETKLFQYIKDNIFNQSIDDVKYNLFKTILNIVKYSEEETINYIYHTYKDDLLKISLDPKIINDKEERIMFISIEILSEILKEEESYEILMKAYVKSINRQSGYRDRYLNLLISKYSAKKTDIQLMLINMYRNSDETLRDIIETQLNKLT